jgi:hypothetical protein
LACAGLDGAGRIAAPRGTVSCRPNAEECAVWEVLKWMGVFVIALLLIVAGLFWLMGRDLPIPQF